MMHPIYSTCVIAPRRGAVVGRTFYSGGLARKRTRTEQGSGRLRRQSERNQDVSGRVEQAQDYYSTHKEILHGGRWIVTELLSGWATTMLVNAEEVTSISIEVKTRTMKRFGAHRKVLNSVVGNVISRGCFV
ncbi:hypothetical protein BJV74DRAFT_193559 [Russula compacta]|nr:hypothetical protein BJV74DRAFT_193559 [Russula compacta]